MAVGIGRRQFIAGLGGAVATWPLAARAQQPAMPVIGFLSAGAAKENSSRLTAFHQALTRAGYVEGRNVATVYRWADNKYERLPDLSADLVGKQVNIIVAADGISARAAKAATATIPIVFDAAVDPVTAGLVASLAHPGNNLTGTANLGAALEQKKLEIIHELIPAASKLGVLLNPTNPNLYQSSLQNSQAVAAALGQELQVVRASTEPELDIAFAELNRQRVDALSIGLDVLFTAHSAQLAALALQYRIPAIYQYREFAFSGGLVSYGTSLKETYSVIGTDIARILNGVKPTELPVQEITKLELVINLKTAKALDLTIPLPLLGRADEVIE